MGTPRRYWLKLFGKTIAGLCLGGWAVALLRSAKPHRVRDLSSQIVLGPAAAFPPGAYTFLDASNVHVIHRANGICAISGRCTHLGCSVSDNPDGFVCPCHGARFDQLGQPISGPATRPLPWYRVSIDADKKVRVHLDETVETGTWVRS